MKDLFLFNEEINVKFEVLDFLGKINMVLLYEAVDNDHCRFFLETKCKREITYFKSKGMFAKALGMSRQHAYKHYNTLKEAGLIIEESNNYDRRKG